MVEIESKLLQQSPPDDDKEELRDIGFIDILGDGSITKRIIKPGLGQDSRPSHGDSAVISYKGWLEDGTLVEEENNIDIVIGDGEFIHAFDLGLLNAEMKEEFELKTTSRFGYGDLGKEPEIPGKANLVYHVTLENCSDPPCYEKMPIEQRFEISDRKRERGNFYFRRNEFQYALNCYTKAGEILQKRSANLSAPGGESKAPNEFPPCSPAQLLDLEIKLKNNIAATQLKLEAFSAAVRTCNSVLHLDPTNRKALFRKAHALLGSDDLPEAITVFEEALRLDPDSVRLKSELQKARATLKRQRGQQARALSRAFKLKGSNMTAAAVKTHTSSINKIGWRLRSIWSSYKLAISAVAIAGLSVTIGAFTVRYSEPL